MSDVRRCGCCGGPVPRSVVVVDGVREVLYGHPEEVAGRLRTMPVTDVLIDVEGSPDPRRFAVDGGPGEVARRLRALADADRAGS